MKAEAPPLGLKAPPRHAPRRLRSTADLRSLQRLMTRALVRPLAAGDRLQSRWIDGRPMGEVAGEFIKPNALLSSRERLEIYNRLYWYRLLGCMRDDCPALLILLGERRFDRLARAYLARCPSRSFTLRNLCSRLPRFIREQPRWTAPRSGPAHAVALFEWAQTVAFDAEARPALTADDLADRPPARLRVGLQPYLSLLQLDYNADEYAVAAKRRSALRAEASNTPDGPERLRRRQGRPPALRRGRIYLAVHRFQGRLYHKRLDRAAFLALQALGAGRTLAQAVAAFGRDPDPEAVREAFAGWARLGWLCARRRGSSR